MPMTSCFIDQLVITCSYDVRAIKFDIEEVEQWADSNHLNLNPTKCKYMLISRKQCATYSFAKWSPTGKS